MTLEEWAVRTPDSMAITSPRGERTFAELDAAANRVARALRARGLGPGDGVALLCTNRPEFAEVYFACVRSGLRLTPINWHLGAEEVAYIAEDSDAKILIAEDHLVDRLGADTQRVLRPSNLLIGDGTAPGFDDYAETVAEQPDEPVEDPAPGGLMMYTSGTTGKPKGVRRPLGSLSPAQTANLAGYQPGDKHLLTGPLYHSAPLAFSMSVPIGFGAGIVMTERFDAADTLRLIAEQAITHTHMVPTMFHRLLALPEETKAAHDTSALRYILHGAAPCPVAVKRRVIEWFGPIVWEYYAATEGFATIVSSETWLEHPGTVGRPIVEGNVYVGDVEGTPQPAGEVGSIYIRSPEASRFEYLNDGDKTHETFRGDFFSLGDLGYMDADGFLYLTDRSANLIISGGVNIYPAEVDGVLLEHPSVGDVATIGVPDSEWGEAVLAVVELKPGITPSDELAEELIAFSRERLAHYKCPRAVEFEEQLPRSDNGKVYKRLLRDQHRARRSAGQAPHQQATKA